MITIERNVHFGKGRRTRKELRVGDETSPAPVGRIPRVSRLMALAIRFDQLIRDGVVTDQADLARLGHVTRARLTQIMNLLSLAPDLQEAILFLPATERGRESISSGICGQSRRWWIGGGSGRFGQNWLDGAVCLKVENEILGSKLPTRITVTEKDKNGWRSSRSITALQNSR